MERIKKLIVVILCVGMISSLNISFIYASQSNGYHPLNIKIESPDVPKTVTPKRNARSLDSYYSSSELGQVTSVKDQGNTELCWAFGITSMGETSLIKQGIASTNVDFSEKHFGYFMYNRKNKSFRRLEICRWQFTACNVVVNRMVWSCKRKYCTI